MKFGDLKNEITLNKSVFKIYHRKFHMLTLKALKNTWKKLFLQTP